MNEQPKTNEEKESIDVLISKVKSLTDRYYAFNVAPLEVKLNAYRDPVDAALNMTTEDSLTLAICSLENLYKMDDCYKEENPHEAMLRCLMENYFDVFTIFCRSNTAGKLCKYCDIQCKLSSCHTDPEKREFVESMESKVQAARSEQNSEV